MFCMSTVVFVLGFGWDLVVKLIIKRLEKEISSRTRNSYHQKLVSTLRCSNECHSEGSILGHRVFLSRLPSFSSVPSLSNSLSVVALYSLRYFSPFFSFVLSLFFTPTSLPGSATGDGTVRWTSKTIRVDDEIFGKKMLAIYQRTSDHNNQGLIS